MIVLAGRIAWPFSVAVKDFSSAEAAIVIKRERAAVARSVFVMKFTLGWSLLHVSVDRPRSKEEDMQQIRRAAATLARPRMRGAAVRNPIGRHDDGWVMLALQPDEALVTGLAGDGEACPAAGRQAIGALEMTGEMRLIGKAGFERSTGKAFAPGDHLPCPLQPAHK